MTQVDERNISGFKLLPGFLDRHEQSGLVDAVREVIRTAPLVRPVTRWGRQMSVRMTSAGAMPAMRRAGIHAAKNPKAARLPATETYVSGSVGEMP